MKNNISINVIESDTLQPLLQDITALVAQTILRTFGPYGQNTLIQSPSTVYSTKDGWTVAKNTKVTDSQGVYSAPANAIKKLLLDVAQSVIVNAGDGSSTAIISANIMNKSISHYAKSAGLGTKELEEIIETCTDMVCNVLKEWAIPVNGDLDIIRKIARISTNWDSNLADMIADIYEKTNNPIIKVEDSGNTETYYEIIEGYDIAARLELPNYCLTTDKGTFEADNPVILTFNSAVGMQHIETLVYISTQLDSKNKKFVVIAPVYDQDFINILANINSQAAAKGDHPINLVPIKYYAPGIIDKDCVADFVSLTGGVLMSNQYDKVHDTFTVLNTKLHDESKPHGTDINKINDELMKNVMSLAGTCKHIVATDKFVRIEGLTNANEEEFNGRKRELKAILDAKYKQYVSDAAITESIRQIRLRLGKMECKQGIIKVGGFGSAHIASRKDALDDAIRACEVAYNDGYVVDGGIAIAQAIDSILISEAELPNKHIANILQLYKETFIRVAALMYNNRYHDLNKSTEIAKTYASARDICYDLITEQATTDLITPVDVLIEVMKGCMRLVLVNTTSNQFVFMNADDLIKTIQAESVADDANRQTDD